MNTLKRNAIALSTKVMAFGGVIGTMLFGMNEHVYAAAGGSVLPSWLQNIVDQFSDLGTTEGWINTQVRIALTALFVIVFLVAIAYSALAAIKFITSQGESGKLEESKAAVKAILMGFGAMILAIVGLFVILVLLGAGGETPNTYIKITNS